MNSSSVVEWVKRRRHCIDSCDTLLKLVGGTPAVWLNRLRRQGYARILVKLEYFNPTGSHKDRIAVFMLCDALERGKIAPGDVIVEASSGNTGVSLAWAASLLGLKPVILVPENTSSVKVNLMRLLGAEVRFVSVKDVPIIEEIARQVADELGGFYVNQFGNPANPRAHYETTGPELYEQANGRIDVFVMGVGTGGTITGVGRFLREKLGGKVRIVAVVPKGSRLVRKSCEKPDVIEGLAGSYKKPDNLDLSLVDEIVEVSAGEAADMALALARYEGILAGHSTGAMVAVALRYAAQLEEDAVVATIAADSIQRYPWLLERVRINLNPP